MSRFTTFLNEKSSYGAGLTMIDIDETVFRTFAKIIVRDKTTKEKIIELNNQEFNSYTLKNNEEFDFGEFRDAKLFRKTSIPIPKTVNRIKKMMGRIKDKELESRIIFLTARSDFDDKYEVLNTFKDHGIDMTPKIFHIERAGNDKTGTVPEIKQKIIVKYLMTGKYRRCRLIDDHKPNINALIEIEKKFGKIIDSKVKEYYNIKNDEQAVKYFGLWVTQDGTLQLV